MQGINKVILVGNLATDVEVRYTASGAAVGNCNIAVNEIWKDKDGNKQEAVEFIKLVFWNRTAEVAGEYLQKGSPVYIEGKFKTEEWTDNDGHKRYTTKVHVTQLNMLPSGRDSNNGGFKPRAQASPPAQQNNTPQKPQKDVPSMDDFDDEIPF
jgi:single-strand DNA-binding protein